MCEGGEHVGKEGEEVCTDARERLAQEMEGKVDHWSKLVGQDKVLAIVCMTCTSFL